MTAIARPLEEWNEGVGPALWWRFPVEEPPYSGTPLDQDWPGYHTHFTTIEVPELIQGGETSGEMVRALVIDMLDGSKWAVPVEVIAEDRARHYAHEFVGDLARSLAEDTGPLFEEDPYACEDWARNNMNWQDVAPYAWMVKPAPPVDMQEGWLTGRATVINVRRK